MKHGLLLCIILLFSLPAYATKRVALVIGNNDYQHINVLGNPIADAKAVATELKALGFTLIRPIRDKDVQTNLTQLELIKAKNALKKAANGAEIAFLFYAGHGASLGTQRSAHILPVSVEKPTADATGLELLTSQSMSLDTLLAGLDKSAQLTVAVFDACREIPALEKNRSVFSNLFNREASWRGLNRLSKGKKRIIAYSAAIGQLAADGSGRHSPYTTRLLSALQQNPHKEIGDLFRDIAIQVDSSTGQEPELSIQGVPSGTFYFSRANTTTSNTDKTFWGSMKDCHTLSCYQAYLKQYPNGQYVSQAQAGLQALKKAIKPSRLPFEPKMVKIRGGRFQMGSPADEKGRDDNEKQRTVRVKDFSLGQYEVTFAEWDACVIAAGGCAHKPDDNGWGRGQRPVMRVSWNDAQGYIAWLNKQTGKNYRLPTEAEWEYAARAGTTTAFSFGDAITTEQANFNGNYPYNNGKEGRYLEKTAEVGQYPANRFGLYDMHGNVWEWTCSAYNKNYQGEESRCATARGAERVLRGGCWGSSGRFARSAVRLSYSPDNRIRNIGLRLALGHPSSSQP